MGHGAALVAVRPEQFIQADAASRHGLIQTLSRRPTHRSKTTPMPPRKKPDSPSIKLSSGLVGTAGEYLVAGELSRRGWIASLTIRNARGVDILVSDGDAKRSAGIQVKTSRGGKPSWPLNKKVANPNTADNLFFVFVLLNGLNAPAYYVVPKKDVAHYVYHGHREWLRTPGTKGQQRNDTDMRQFDDPDGQYLGRWDLLGL